MLRFRDLTPSPLLLGIALLSLQGCSCTKDEVEHEQVDAIEELKVIPGDGKVYLQWSLWEDVWYFASIIETDVYRATSTQGFSQIGGFDYMPLQYWNFVDSDLENSVEHSYFVELRFFGAVEDPYKYDISDTIAVTPDSGLSEPIPDPPASLSVTAEDDSSFVLSWIPPEGCDSLYYLLLYSPDDEYYYPSGYGWHPNDWYPIRLDMAQYRFENLKDGHERYYVVIAFVDSLMSKVSAPVSVKHE